MSDRDWERFFELIEKIVNLKGLSANEKTVLVAEKAKEAGESAAVDFGEFTAWDFSAYLD